eukprot:scaffold196838_cov20-Tisochrysis_lutea.AAC.3
MYSSTTSKSLFALHRPMVPPPEGEQQGPSAMDVSDKEDDAASQGSWDVDAQYQPLPYITQHVGRLNIVRAGCSEDKCSAYLQ